MVRIETGWPSLLRWKIEFYFDLYRSFLDSQDELANQAFEDWNRKLDEQAQEFDEDVRDEFYEIHSDEYTSREYFKVILMNSFFVASYDLYEYLREEIRDRFPVTKSDFESSDLKKTPEWRAVNHYKKIRNIIMHKGGVIPKCEEDAAFAKCKCIEADYFPSGTYALTRGFCDEALDTFQRYLLIGLKEFSSSVWSLPTALMIAPLDGPRLRKTAPFVSEW